MNNSDRARFVHDLFEFNDTAPAGNAYRRFNPSMMEIRSPSLGRSPIVDVHGWCLMGNHYHLLLSERVEGGLSLFSRRLNVGYAMYFNEKHRRSGVLFQGRTKKIPITSDAHFLHILHYIHLNPLDFHKESGDWRDMSIANHERALRYLDGYRWSSYLDYCGKDNFHLHNPYKWFGWNYEDQICMSFCLYFDNKSFILDKRDRSFITSSSSFWFELLS